VISDPITEAGAAPVRVRVPAVGVILMAVKRLGAIPRIETEPALGVIVRFIVGAAPEIDTVPTEGEILKSWITVGVTPATTTAADPG